MNFYEATQVKLIQGRLKLAHLFWDQTWCKLLLVVLRKNPFKQCIVWVGNRATPMHELMELKMILRNKTKNSMEMASNLSLKSRWFIKMRRSSQYEASHILTFLCLLASGENWKQTPKGLNFYSALFPTLEFGTFPNQRSWGMTGQVQSVVRLRAITWLLT